MLTERPDDESGRTHKFCIYDDSDSVAVMKRLLKEDAEKRRRREQEEVERRLGMLPGARDSTSSSSRGGTSSLTHSRASSSSTGSLADRADSGFVSEGEEEDDSAIPAEKAESMLNIVLEYKRAELQRRLAESEGNRFARRPEREKGSWAEWVERYAARYEVRKGEDSMT